MTRILIPDSMQLRTFLTKNTPGRVALGASRNQRMGVIRNRSSIQLSGLNTRATHQVTPNLPLSKDPRRSVGAQGLVSLFKARV